MSKTTTSFVDEQQTRFKIIQDIPWYIGEFSEKSAKKCKCGR
jgi:hypothetical protein